MEKKALKVVLMMLLAMPVSAHPGLAQQDQPQEPSLEVSGELSRQPAEEPSANPSGKPYKESCYESPQGFSLWERWFSWKDKWLYMRARDAVDAGAIHFAFMDFAKVHEGYPRSRFSDDALFATGEYYFRIGAYSDAFRTFNRFIKEYPQSDMELFALGYLLKIARLKERKAIIPDLEKMIISAQQSSLLFREFKEYNYLSPFSRQYKAACFIDKIEFYVDGELFAQVSF